MVTPVQGARPAVATDRDALMELRRLARTSVAPMRGGRLLAELDRPDSIGERLVDLALGAANDDVTVTIGTLDDLMVGYALVRVERSESGERVAVITELFVDAWARELGVGEALMDQVLSWSRSARCSGLDAVALPGDRATKNFFESNGMVARAIVVHRALTAAPVTELLN